MGLGFEGTKTGLSTGVKRRRDESGAQPLFEIFEVLFLEADGRMQHLKLGLLLLNVLTGVREPLAPETINIGTRNYAREDDAYV